MQRAAIIAVILTLLEYSNMLDCEYQLSLALDLATPEGRKAEFT